MDRFIDLKIVFCVSALVLMFISINTEAQTIVTPPATLLSVCNAELTALNGYSSSCDGCDGTVGSSVCAEYCSYTRQGMDNYYSGDCLRHGTGNPVLSLSSKHQFVYQCPEGTSQSETDPTQCEYQCPEAGTPAGIDEGADGPPGYATKCYGQCSIIGYEYFQRTDNDLWVISYIYTGTECGDGDPMGEPTAPPGTPVPDTVSPTTDTDTDGDGIPDHNDPDIDGDGIPNSQDTDQDGDGVDDVDDPTPQGRPPKDDPSKANVGPNCEQIPTCSGDAIQCAQLIEIWRLRCKTSPPNTQEISESLDDDIISGSVNAGEQALQNASDEIIGALDDESGISLSTDLQNPITALFNGVTCTDIGFEFEGNVFNISCTETQLMRDVMAFILYVTTIVYLYQLARKPVEN